MVFSKAKELFKPNERVLFVIVEDDAQIIAGRILGRKLTDKELYRVSKGLEYGLGEGFEITLKTAIQSAVDEM